MGAMTAVRRLAAYLIDWCLFACWGGVVFVVTWFGQAGEPAWPANPWLGQALGFSLTTLPFGLYFALLESSGRQATVGKRLLGLRVVTLDGARPAPGRTMLRAAVKLLPWELGHVVPYQMVALPADAEMPGWVLAVSVIAMLAALAYVVALWSPSGRTPYDRISGTRVER